MYFAFIPLVLTIQDWYYFGESWRSKKTREKKRFKLTNSPIIWISLQYLELLFRTRNSELLRDQLHLSVPFLWIDCKIFFLLINIGLIRLYCRWKLLRRTLRIEKHFIRIVQRVLKQTHILHNNSFAMKMFSQWKPLGRSALRRIHHEVSRNLHICFAHVPQVLFFLPTSIEEFEPSN